jgi:hypothetical protein
MSLTGKGNERCQSHMVNNPKDKTLLMEIDQVDHVKRFDYYSKDIMQNLEQKDYLLRN